METKSRFGLNRATVGGGNMSTKLPPGKYRLRIEKCFVRESQDRKRAAATYFIAEVTVVQVMEGGETTTDKHETVFPAAKAGDHRSWSLNMAFVNSAGNLNEFLAAVDGTDPSDPKALEAAAIDFDALLEDAIDTKNPMRGAEVDVLVVLKLTDGNNNYLAHRFSVAK
jgi:hypothetical protein